MSHEIPAINRVREQARRRVEHLNGFDYSAPAELFPSRSVKGRGRVTYRRFESAAEAVRFAVEEMSAGALLGAYLEVDEVRFGAHEIRCLYDHAAYPLTRPAKTA